MTNPASFESLAAKYSQDASSAKNGGDLGWQMLAQLDPYFAGYVYRMNKGGQISGVFKSGFGYHIVKYIEKRPVTYDKVEKMIITVEGIDKEVVGQVASEIRAVRPPEPYKGKGIKYTDEIIRRKAGKAAAKTSAA